MIIEYPYLPQKMFTATKNLMSEAIGTADNCSVVLQKDKARSESSFATLLVPGETPYILLKSIKKEYLFTDQGVLISSGEAAVGTKRLARRYNWFESPIRFVMFETAGYGITDLDCEIKFTIGSENISVDIKKQDDPNARIAVATLADLARVQSRNAQKLRLVESTLTRTVFNGAHLNGDADERANINTLLDELNPLSYADVFERNLAR